MCVFRVHYLQLAPTDYTTLAEPWIATLQGGVCNELHTPRANTRRTSARRTPRSHMRRAACAEYSMFL